MATPISATMIRRATRPWVVLWLASIGVLATLLALLSIAVKNNPVPSQDRTVLDWIAGWDLPGLTGFLEVVSFLTNNWPAMVLGLLGVGFLWFVGLTREAKSFFIIGGIVGLVAFLSDYTFGEIVGRARPLPEDTGVSFPSGHTFGTTALFGFWGFLAVYYGLRRKLLIPLLTLLAAFIVAVGFSRIHLGVHWPTDVVAGYLFGILWLLVLIPFFLYLRKATWLSSKRLGEDLVALACEECRIERSIASVVVLDPEQGTATKVYKPPPVVRLLYWLAFQARFPYTNNSTALEAAVYRRKIASLLTVHRFGKDLVAPATAVNCDHGDCSFVTEFVPGDKVENDEEAKRFLTQVAETFSEAGLSVWQVNPRNPHAHTNLIRTPEGDFKIIDLESAVVTLLPARGQWLSSLKSGKIPVFDDIDFPRFRDYLTTNNAPLEASLGTEGLAELKDAIDRGEQAIQAWKDAELRIWGHLVGGIYRLLDVKGFSQHLMGALQGADAAAEGFLKRGMARWEAEGKLKPSEAALLRAHISSGEAQAALPHLGAHLVLSVALAIPIPGLRSLARFFWTLTFWIKAQIRRLFRRKNTPARSGSNIHTPLVMVLALVPGFGGVAYLAARPLRKKLLVRLMMDQMAWSFPFKLYRRLHLARWLAPPPRETAEANVEAGT